MKMQNKRVKLLHDKFILKRKNPELMKKYNVPKSFIDNAVQSLIKDRLDQPLVPLRPVYQCKRLNELQITFIDNYIKAQNSHVVNLMEIRHQLLQAFPELERIALSTIWKVITKLLGYSHKQCSLFHKDRNSHLNVHYRFYYYYRLFKSLDDNDVLVFIDETGN